MVRQSETEMAKINKIKLLKESSPYLCFLQTLENFLFVGNISIFLREKPGTGAGLLENHK